VRSPPPPGRAPALADAPPGLCGFMNARFGRMPVVKVEEVEVETAIIGAVAEGRVGDLVW
jgi:hypothetical protein